jgi:hypothetical protein
MVRILQSAWATMLVGAILFLGTTAVLLKPGKFHIVQAETPEAAMRSIASGLPGNFATRRWTNGLKRSSRRKRP